MPVVEESIEVDVPVSAAYERWTRFEDYPRFMVGIDEIRRLDETRLLWRTRVGGFVHAWEARVTALVPDTQVAWASVSGARMDGSVTLHARAASRTLVVVRFEFDWQGTMETEDEEAAYARRRVRTYLRAFKDLVESDG